MPSILNSDSGAVSGSAGLKFDAADDGILEIQNDGVTSFVVSNQYIKVPSGNTASRPAIAALGMIRFNSESERFEAYNGNNWLNVSSLPEILVDYLVIAGGGGGAGYASGGGGGGYVESNTTVSVASSYTVTVGAGGTKGGDDSLPSNVDIAPTNGSNSSIFSVTALGGGAAGLQTSTNPLPGKDGGSGGGGGRGTNAAGTGLQPTFTPGIGFGNNGGTFNNNSQGGGGGGAGGAATGARSQIGGIGKASSITGTSVYYAGGGGGSGYPGDTAGPGGLGGGGAGGAISSTEFNIGQNGTTNLGGGGGGGNLRSTPSNQGAYGGNGGSGVVILKYPNTRTISNPGGGLTFNTDDSTVSGYKVTTFTAGTGNIQFS